MLWRGIGEDRHSLFLGYRLNCSLLLFLKFILFISFFKFQRLSFNFCLVSCLGTHSPRVVSPAGNLTREA